MHDFSSIREELKDQPDDKKVNVFSNELDDFDQLILKEGLRIAAVHCHKQLDLLLVVLNNKHTIKLAISSDYKRLQNAPEQQLNNLEFIAGNSGIHWPDLDEDLSLKGFLIFPNFRSWWIAITLKTVWHVARNPYRQY